MWNCLTGANKDGWGKVLGTAGGLLKTSIFNFLFGLYQAFNNLWIFLHGSGTTIGFIR